MSRRLVLASASPRRRELLAGLGVGFDVRPAAVDETSRSGEPPERLVVRLATAKAEAAARPKAAELLIGADTVVTLDGDVLGKPADGAEAEHMLRRLAGRSHRVLTGVAVHDPASGRTEAGLDDTEVVVAPLSAERIRWYVASGEPFDKAGAYAIQGLASLLIPAIRGNYSNVVGLPLPLLDELLRRQGYELMG